MNEQELIRKAMKAIGSRKSPAKAAAARANGAKGGRPVNPLVRALAAGLGCTAAQLVSDLAKTNYRP
jgi:hypothetical protein